MTNHDQWAIRLAKVVSERSKDPSTKVGAVILDQGGRILSAGFNGFPRGIADDDRLHDRATKYRITRHAESNALAFAQGSVVGATLFVTHPCCVSCACDAIQHGIARVVFPSPDDDLLSRWGDDYKLALDLFAEAGVDVVELPPE